MEVTIAASVLVVVVLALPAVAVALSPCHDDGTVCDDYEVELFEVCVMMSQATAAAVSVSCVFRKMAMYGVRKFLFVDPELGSRIRFQKEYAAKIKLNDMHMDMGLQWRQQHGHGAAAAKAPTRGYGLERPFQVRQGANWTMICCQGRQGASWTTICCQGRQGAEVQIMTTCLAGADHGELPGCWIIGRPGAGDGGGRVGAGLMWTEGDV